MGAGASQGAIAFEGTELIALSRYSEGKQGRCRPGSWLDLRSGKAATLMAFLSAALARATLEVTLPMRAAH
jgi:hypothetical protein